MNTLTNFRNSLMDIAFEKLVYCIFYSAAKKANKKITDQISNKDGGYKCIHLSIPEFIRGLNLLKKLLKLTPETIRKRKFIDVGCGVGQKVYLAHTAGFNAYGLELRPSLYHAARHLFLNLNIYKHPIGQFTTCRPESFFIKGNALKFDYSEFDIIYFYSPLRNDDMEIEMEKRIATTAHRGAVVLGYLPKYFIQPINGWRQLVKGQLYQKC